MQLYYDLGSPYAFLAVERVERILGAPPELEPILLGAIFRMRGRGSWAATGARDENVAELKRRASRYGLPQLRWPDDWPVNTLAAMRAATWAKQLGAVDAFTHVAFRRAFLDGRNLGDLDVLRDVARDAGLDPDAMLEAIERPEIKQRLREATDAAWERGVRGVPTLVRGERIFYGDDQLEAAA